MPATVNGIGTTYYGKKNLTSRPGKCPHCARNVQLSSYDTRLWFVVVFIPVIPLGRKRILDQCPVCKRHFVADADKWETTKQLEVSGAADKFRAAPTPEHAVEYHRKLLAFHQNAEAATFREEASRQFPESAMLQAHFGDVLTELGRPAEGAPFYTRALALRADLPAARTGVAEGHIREGRLDEARPLLSHLESPGASQLYSLAPLERLALGYQKAGRHHEALTLFAKELEGLPTLSDHKGFRTMVQKSEKALAQKKSMLPKRRFKWRDLFSRSTAAAPTARQSNKRTLIAVGVLLLLIGGIMEISNEYIRRHRTLHIVNAYGQPATVEIKGTDVNGKFRGLSSVELSEGHYQAVITGPVNQTVDFEVSGDYFGRWGDHPAWVLNIGGDAILIKREVIYSKNGDHPPGAFEIHFGQPFESLANVTYPLEDSPKTLELSNDNEVRTEVELQPYKGNGLSIMEYFLDKKDPEHALAVGESWLRTHPADEPGLQLYYSTAKQQSATARADAFLKIGLAVRPVRIEWHRLYQQEHDNPKVHAALLKEYDALLATAPGDSALLYLRGRIDWDHAVTRAMFNRAIQADAHNPFPLYGLAYDRMAAGDWVAARPLLAKALTLQPKNQNYAAALALTRLALGEAAAVEADTREQIKSEHKNPVLTNQLVDALAAQDHRKEALQTSDAYAKVVAPDGDDGKASARYVHLHTLYALGQFDDLAKAASSATPADQTVRAQVLIEQGHLEEAVKMLPTADPEEQIIESLTLAVAWRQAGNATEADHWLDRARQVLAKGDEDEVQAAGWLGTASPPNVATAQDAGLPPRFKAILLVAVMAWHPESRADLAPLTQRLNMERVFPYHFVQHALAAGP